MRHLLLVPLYKRHALVGLPAMYAVDLVRYDHERGLESLQYVEGFDGLRQKSFAYIDYKDCKIRKRATAAPKSCERMVPGRIDKKQSRNDEFS